MPIFLAGLAITACHFEAKHFGTPGRLEQTWSSYLDCPEAQCGTGEGALAAGGATSVLSVQTLVPIARLQSSAPDVVAVDEVSKPRIFQGAFGSYFHVPVTSGVAGTATLQFQDDGGVLVDEVELRVATPVDVELEALIISEPTVVVASTIAVSATPLGSDGRALFGHGSIQFSSDGVVERVHGGANSLDAIVEERYPDTGLYVARAPGVGQAVVTVPGATRTVSLHAIAAEEVDRQSIQFTSIQTTLRGGWLLDYVAEARGMPVYGSACGWAVLDPTIASVDVFPADLSLRQSTFVSFGGESPGRTTAVCMSRAGERKLTVEIEVEPQP
jgi:hypothetical protein